MTWPLTPPPSLQFKVVPFGQTELNPQQYARPVELFNDDGSPWNPSNAVDYPRSLPAGTALAGTFDTTRSTYNTRPSATQKFRAAVGRALSGGASARILIIGDSITYGVGATTKSARYATVLQSMISARVGASVCGTGFIPAYDGYGVAPADSRFSGNAPVHDNGLGGVGPGIMGTNGYLSGAKTWTFTPGRTDIDQFTVYYYKNQYATASNLTVLVDGASVGTINCNQASGSSIGATSFTVAAGSAHTLGLQTTAANGGLLLGVEGRVNGGLGGITVSGVGNPGMGIDYLVNTADGPSASLNCIAQQAPDLTMILHQTNDYYGTQHAFAQTTIATYTANWQTAITTAKAAGGDVAVITSWPPQTLGKTIPINAYTQALYGLADSNNLPLIDIQAATNDWATQSALSAIGSADHPNTAGHYQMAAIIYGALQKLGAGLP